ncbi:MAG: DUF2520 domain-containing protein [Bacteroidales bacterium]|nr:DUF2520 domain-containing protein [Bacteroidales bacterium]
MNKSIVQTAVLIGAGNVGWHLGNILNEKGIKILQVISKSESSCKELATLLQAEYDTRLKKLAGDAGIIIVTVPDTQINNVIDQCDFRDNLVVHTAGSIPMSVFNNRAINYGVFYPLMTFTRKKPLNFVSIPLLIEANTTANLNKLSHLAGLLSGTVSTITSAQRKIIHLGAVIASNFSNHMYALAESLLTREGISFDLLKPLIRETADKITRVSPLSAQTGPAARNDTRILEEHLKVLAEDPEIAELYKQISKSIITFAGKKKDQDQSKNTI